MDQHSDGGNAIDQGSVFKKTLGNYFVDVRGETVVCSISNKLRKQLVYPIADASSVRQRVVDVKDIEVVDPIAIGDIVRFVDMGDGTGMIREVLPRTSELARRAPGPKPLEQVIVANVDQVIPVFAAARPRPKWRLLDRYLATAEAAGISVIICITKLDLAKMYRLQATIEVYEEIGYPVILTSAVTGEGIGDLETALKDKLSVFVGKSGVGKTTLLNTIQPDLGLRIDEVSQATNKGKHTTSHLEMFSLDLGGSVVDTPGMREFGLWEVDGTDLAYLFREMRPHLGRCRFGADCSHTHEPDCAVKEAVEAGGISEMRYESYVRMKA